jgi:serine phosphatase RsbU (regulator of sigma subunit)
MTLRVRLIVAFLVLAVVPLAAMTWYSYSSNAQALRNAAERESDRLASDLSRRMQLITMQLSERVEHLMDIEGESSAAMPLGQPVAPPVAPAVSAAAAPAGNPAADLAAAEAVAAAAFEEQVAERLGDAALLLKNVELRGLRPGRGRLGRGEGRRGSGTSGPPAPEARAGFGRGRGRGARGDRPPPAEAQPAQLPQGPSPDVARAEGSAAPPGIEGPVAPRFEGPVLPSTAATASSPGDRLTIDLSAIRRQMFREIAPPDTSFEAMTPAQRERVISEVNQRLLGIEQGLKLGAEELQKQAAEAKRDAQAVASLPQPSKPRTVTNAGSVTKTLALSGNRLNIRREQNGIVRQINAEVNLPDLLSTVFSATTRDRNEVPFAVDTDGRVYTTAPEERKTIEALGGEFLRPGAKPGTTRLPEWIVVTTADPTGSGLRFGIARPVGDALSEVRTTAARTAGLGLLFIVVTLIGVVPLSAGLTRSLSRLNEGVRRIAAGDFAARVPVTTQDEIGKLARAFNQMAEDVEKHERVALEQERFKRELELGRQIQNDMLPQAPLRVGGTELQGVSVAAGEVGGDFFNYFETGTGQVALLVGDVSGKGVGAALLMANIQASLRARLTLGQSLTALAEGIDRQIQADTPEPVYATLFVAILDPATRVLRYVNAGHNPPYLLHKEAGVERLESSGLPVGLLAGRGYTEQEVQLARGDVVFCYTDGCVDAENETGVMFGADALERALAGADTSSADALLRRMEETLRMFRGTREPSDDATMMVVTVG